MSCDKILTDLKNKFPHVESGYLIAKVYCNLPLGKKLMLRDNNIDLAGIQLVA